MLNIQNPEDLIVDKLTSVIYGAPGTGKTSIAFTTESPLLLDCGLAGSHRAVLRGDTVFVKDFKEIQQISKDLKQLEKYKTIIIDDVGSLIDLMSYQIIHSGKKGASYNGVLAQQGWGELKLVFQNFYTELKKLDKDIIFIAHDKEKDVDGERPLTRPDIAGSTYSLIRKYSDVIAFVETKGKETYLNFSPGEKVVAKNCAGLDIFKVPHFKEENFNLFFAGITQTIKDSLNSKSRIFATFNRFREEIGLLETPMDFKEMATQMKSVEDKNVLAQIKEIFVAKMKSLGIKYIKETDRFVDESELETETNHKSDLETGEKEMKVSIAHIEQATKDLVEKKLQSFKERIEACKTMKCFEEIYKEYTQIEAPAVKEAVGKHIAIVMLDKGLIYENGKILKLQNKAV